MKFDDTCGEHGGGSPDGNAETVVDGDEGDPCVAESQRKYRHYLAREYQRKHQPTTELGRATRSLLCTLDREGHYPWRQPLSKQVKGRFRCNRSRLDLLASAEKRVRQANPVAKRAFHRLLRRSTEAQLHRILQRAKVTRSGDITLA